MNTGLIAKSTRRTSRLADAKIVSPPPKDPLLSLTLSSLDPIAVYPLESTRLLRAHEGHFRRPARPLYQFDLLGRHRPTREVDQIAVRHPALNQFLGVLAEVSRPVVEAQLDDDRSR